MNAQAAYLRDIPVTKTQPDGSVIHCFASGDEFFNYLHDANGYTIIQHPQTGYYVYAEKQDGKLVATNYVVGKYDPSSKGLVPYVLISPEEWMARRKAWEVPDEHRAQRSSTPNHGTLNNIVIFIRFADDDDFTNTFSSIDNMFNKMTGSYGTSMRSYFQAASYGALDIPTHFFPGHNGEIIISYKDNQPKSYYQPFNETTNPDGYDENDDDERRVREFDLLERAINYVNANYPVPTDLNIDYDDDGYVDNVCFIVRGNVGAWSSLLWPHMWSLWEKNAYINGKRVWTFNFQLADATNYFNTSTMCHEMNHSLGAPDLYHYYNGTNISPVGKWDLMENNTTPPQHMGAYMKMEYGHWIDEIPEITRAGTYTLNPLSSPTAENVAYKIATEDPNQFYVVEYRDKSTETALPGSGLLVYRIDTRFNGNQNYNPANGIYDEVYIFRPNGTVSSGGSINSAHFSSGVNRTEFSSSTSPYPFLSDGTLDNNMMIYDITTAGNTISFKFGLSLVCDPPTNLAVSVSGRNATLTWDVAENAQSYKIYRDGILIANTESTTYTDSNLSYKDYRYSLKSVDSEGLVSDFSEEVTAEVRAIPVLTATMENDNAILSWDEVEWAYVYPSTPMKTLTYGSSNYYGSDGYGYNIKMYWGHRYPSANIGNYDGKLLYSVSFYAIDPGKYKVFVYEGSTSGHPTSQVVEQAVTVAAKGWIDILLENPHTVDGTQDLWVFIYDDNGLFYPASCCQYSGTNGAYYSTNPTAIVYDMEYYNIAYMVKTHLSDGEFTYNLYQDGTVVVENLTETTYTVKMENDATHQYTVTTNYHGGVSEASNMVGFAKGTTSLASLEMADNDKMLVTEGSKLTVTGTLSNHNAENLIIENGAQLIHNSEDVKATVKKNIEGYGRSDAGWQFIATPNTEGLTPSVENGLLSGSYDLYYYDEPAQYWRNHKGENPTSGFSLAHKQGYLYANSAPTTLEFAGTLLPSDEPVTISNLSQKAVVLKGFNLVGNPFACNATVDQGCYVIENGQVVLASGTKVIAPCEGVMVKATEANNYSVTFTKAISGAKGSSNGQSLDLVVTKDGVSTGSTPAVLDRARVRLGEGSNMEKFSLGNKAQTSLALRHDGQDYAVAYADGLKELPLHFKAAEDGTYTIAIEANTLGVDYLHLIDNMTGADIDLLATSTGSMDSYTFTAKTTDYASRFRLVFSTICEDANGDNAPFAYVSNGEIVVSGEGTLQVMDMMGRVIVSVGGHTRCVPTTGMPAGVYILRLIDGENVKTQKMVID